MKAFIKSALAIAVAAASLSAQAVVIDSFNEPAVGGQIAKDEDASNGNGVSSSLNGTMIGGQRDIFVIKAGQTGTDGFAGVQALVNSGVYGFSTTTGDSGVGIIRWDGTTNTGFGQTGGDDYATSLGKAIGSIDTNGFAVAQNLFAGGGGAFVLDVLSADAGFNFTMQVFSTAGAQFSQLTVTSLAGPGVYVIPFTAFALNPLLQCAGGVLAGCADFTQVTAMQAIINFPGTPVVDVDLRIDIVDNTLPEPGALALAGLALVGAGFARRSRKAK